MLESQLLPASKEVMHDLRSVACYSSTQLRGGKTEDFMNGTCKCVGIFIINLCVKLA